MLFSWSRCSGTYKIERLRLAGRQVIYVLRKHIYWMFKNMMDAVNNGTTS